MKRRRLAPGRESFQTAFSGLPGKLREIPAIELVAVGRSAAVPLTCELRAKSVRLGGKLVDVIRRQAFFHQVTVRPVQRVLIDTLAGKCPQWRVCLRVEQVVPLQL